MTNAIVGLCTLELHLPGFASLKEKRGVLKSMLKKLHNKFNVSVAEIDYHDKWQRSKIAISTVSNSTVQVNKVLTNAIQFIETNHPEALITQQVIETL